MKKTTRKEAENAIREWKRIKTEMASLHTLLAEQEAVIETYGRDNLDEFIDSKLALDSGTIVLKAGAAKPIKNGKPLSTAARAELAVLLPPAYVKTSPEYANLFGVQDKAVRQLLKNLGIEIVREDKFAVQ